jgi:hypothetical protein
MDKNKSLKEIVTERLQADVVETKEELLDFFGDDLEKSRSMWLEGDITKIVDFYNSKLDEDERDATVEEMIIIDTAFIEIEVVLKEALELLKIK